MGQSAGVVQLTHETVLAFEQHAGEAEAAMDRSAAAPETFLWSDSNGKRADRVRKGKIVAELWSGKRPLPVPEGLIHDWIGAAFAPGTTAGAAIALVQDYDNHKIVYKPEVVESRLIAQDGGHFEAYLRLLKKKIVTVVLDTYHDIHYRALDSGRWSLCSKTTRICEVERAGKPDEQVGAPDQGHGYLWRLNSYWRFFERENGVYIECRAISLTRDVPAALAWIIEPMVKKLPRDSLIATLAATRSAVTGEPLAPRDSEGDASREDGDGRSEPA